jgi:hypothetical protein
MGTALRDDTQEARILQLLQESTADGGWVSAWDLAQVSLQYCARLNALRKAGHAIENKIEQHGRQRRGFYRIRREVVQVPLIADHEIVRRWHDPEERL